MSYVFLLASQFTNFELNGAKGTIFGEILIIHHFQKKGFFERVYWCVDNLVPLGVEIYECGEQLRESSPSVSGALLLTTSVRA